LNNYLFIFEAIAVFLAVGYLLLAVKQDIRCWIAGIISSTIYLFLMFQANLYMESMLQIFYILMGFYGWLQWNIKAEDDKSLLITTWTFKKHFLVVSSILGFSLLFGMFLGTYTQAALPFLDSLTTFGALVATYMVAKKILENWIYWFFIDAISVMLFLNRELYLTALLFCIYLIIIFFGLRTWIKEYKSQEEA
jgi:nicotinamide mononucleotide transporter|tara:strand:+ start:59 stop:640 length:582 start_codon:yes stop_codon:yes gene_type:complete